MWAMTESIRYFIWFNNQLSNAQNEKKSNSSTIVVLLLLITIIAFVLFCDTLVCSRQYFLLAIYRYIRVHIPCNIVNILVDCPANTTEAWNITTSLRAQSYSLSRIAVDMHHNWVTYIPIVDYLLLSILSIFQFLVDRRANSNQLLLLIVNWFIIAFRAF